MKMFWALYRKELKGLRNIFLTLLGLILGIDVLLATRINSWGYWQAFGLTFLPLAFLIFWGIFRPLSLIRSEWKEGTAPFLRSLPVSGWSMIGAKLLAAFTEWVGLNLAALALSGLFYAAAPLCGANWVTLSDLPPLGEVIKFLTLSIANPILGIFLGAVIFQLAYLLGRLVNRFSGMVSFAATVFLFYLTSKGSEFLARLLSSFPGLSLEAPRLIDIEFVFSFSTVMLFVMLIEFAILFSVTGWLVEKKLEY
ncbi:MAG TPA: hypothetical protein GXZ98_00550 [Firmicutes bacterium]|jgi:ABC-2 type transport system permease protein|nr:hypothetical protein [Bacillota bacterium]